ncbi:unnamed protein product [Notodromas monacha]|uniref:RFX-type winged-helix domain-containing protein n=1 Tax=Notodromas monacha TaxID=399045 RepID=A0A7R9GBZ4_9CRUS|nr:unnamed protein product [Notodromas monacha]CAG0916924.1 unnamed protein product [Notodromas monacha]
MANAALQMFLPVEMQSRTEGCLVNDTIAAVSAGSNQVSGAMDRTRSPLRILMTADGGRSAVVTSSNGTSTLAAALPPNTQFIAVAADGGDSRSYASLQPVNPVVVGDNEAAEDGVSHPTTTFVQYVDGSGDGGIFTATNGQIAYPLYTVGDGVYTSTAGGTFHSSGNGSSPTVAFTSVSGQPLATYIFPHIESATETGSGSTNTGGSHLVNTPNVTSVIASPRTPPITEPGVTYIMATNNSSQASDSDGGQAGVAHATRVSPLTVSECIIPRVQWLMENYETADGVSLPRSTLYKHYLRHCSDHKIEPVNPASFGKLIRSVFAGLRTRRLGTRGNSKYHYYGIRVKSTSLLSDFVGTDDDDMPEDEPGSPTSAESRSDYRNVSDEVKVFKEDIVESNGEVQQNSDAPASKVVNLGRHSPGFLGEPTNPFPSFPEIDFGAITLPQGITLDDVEVFRSLYEEHCEGVLSAVVRGNFNAVDAMWRQFWKPLRDEETKVGINDPVMDEDSSGGEADAKQLTGPKLSSLCECPAVQDFVRNADYIFYQYLVNYLIPDVLQAIPSTLTQSIRNFAKNLDVWLSSAMDGAPSEMIRIKSAAVNAFAQTLRRYTSLNHLAQAARAVLYNTTQIQQMVTDLSRVDFYHVQEQASWVCECDEGMVMRLRQAFMDALQQQKTLEDWAAWLDSVVNRALARYEQSADYANHARQFLLKWSFYSSMVIRDLTLRSAASFGSFHLIRLLYDEYMYYLVEHKVAEANGATPIEIMGRVSSFLVLQITRDIAFLADGHKHAEEMELDSICTKRRCLLEDCNGMSGIEDTDDPGPKKRVPARSTEI